MHAVRNAARDAHETPAYGSAVPKKKGEPTQPGVVGQNLARLLRERGEGPTWLSRQSGVPRSTITGLISGYSPTAHEDTVRRLAAGLGVGFEELATLASGRIGIDEIIAGFRASSFPAALSPPFGADDEAYLRELGSAFWLRTKPNPAVVFFLLQARRAALV